MAHFRSTPDEFLVEELPLEAPAGHGEHLWLWIEKRGEGTEYLARGLAAALGVDHRDIGYAGRKDRWAVARQWYSAPSPLEPADALGLELEGARVLEAARHPRRLRTGQLRGNRFEVVVRELASGELDAAQERAAHITRHGLPNRYGAQRFGRRGDNAAGGRRLLAGERVTSNHRDARFLLSALQSEVFNHVLSHRPWGLDQLVEGDVVWTHETEGITVVLDPARYSAELAAFVVSPSGPIFGRKCPSARGEVGKLELEALVACGVDPDPRSWRLSRGLDLPGARRPLRIPAGGLRLVALDPESARLEVELPAGAYVTVLLEELFANLIEGVGDRGSGVGDREAGDAEVS